MIIVGILPLQQRQKVFGKRYPEEEEERVSAHLQLERQLSGLFVIHCCVLNKTKIAITFS